MHYTLPEPCRYLPNVTLLVADCVDANAALRAMAYTAAGLRCEHMRLLTDVPPQDTVEGVTVVRIPKLQTCAAYNHFMLQDAFDFFSTDHCLTIQADGFVLHPELWLNDFLSYDYIGAPWPPQHWNSSTTRVGNSGFCLRSHKLMQLTREIPVAAYAACLKLWAVVADDVVTCITGRPFLDEAGCRFAPATVGWRFSQEVDLPRHRMDLSKCLGFHGTVAPATRHLPHQLASMSLEQICQGQRLPGGTRQARRPGRGSVVQLSTRSQPARRGGSKIVTTVRHVVHQRTRRV